MSGYSRIEWTDASWNPATGCTKISQGCRHCYAEREWARLAAARAIPNVYTGREFTDVRCHPERLGDPLRLRKPKRIFVNSMSDLFHEAIPDEFLDRVFAIMALARRHVFQVLTKRPNRMRVYLGPSRADAVLAEMRRLVKDECALGVMVARDALSERPQHAVNRAGYWHWPLPNVWLGVSVEDQATADERILPLLRTPAVVRWISAEPLLGKTNLSLWMFPTLWDSNERSVLPCLNWVVAGGETGPKARPMQPDWVRDIRDQCQAAGVPFFLKQWGEYAPAYGNGKVAGIENVMVRVGKKAAGRLLDNRLHDEYPRSPA